MINMKKIVMALQIMWYGIQLAKEVKEIYKWYKKRADGNSPTLNGITEKEAPHSNSDIKIGDITVENSPGCNINIGNQFHCNGKTD
ncbi:Uncharacterised protein [Anaerostipes hadrus]|uniref:Uncharacterized protein n=2 Tax=Anaerostipes hadrus TaxID=649756 RepID=A0A174PTV5_ANAHA|nr:Uncharacterised protein [Anaerostipes hadrus]